MKILLLFFIRAYRTVLSPLLGTHCRFEPSCSCYAHEAITRHGTLKGSLLTFKRILRCHPFAAHGFDPVPPHFSFSTYLAAASEVGGDLARRTASVHASTCGFEHQNNKLIQRRS